MSQKQYVEKPQKVLAEQFEPAAPLPAGACTCNLSAPYEPTGHAPHIHAAGNVYMLHATDWIRTNKWTLQPIDVLPNDQFEELYGNPGGGAPLPTEDA